MNNGEFQTIDHAQLDTVSGGGGKAEIIKKAAGWTWRNVIAPIGGAMGFEWATRPQQPQQQPQQPQQQPPRQ